MAISKEKKGEILKDLKNKVAKQKAIIFVDCAGLKVKDLSTLRRNLKKQGDEIKIAKKTLMRIALKENKIGVNPKKLSGEIGAVFGYKDVTLPAKTVWQFSKTCQNLKILGGVLENEFIDAEKIIELAKLPTKEELFARLVGSISAPLSSFINVLEANIKGLITVLAKAKA